jgi:hypothetical protein
MGWVPGGWLTQLREPAEDVLVGASGEVCVGSVVGDLGWRMRDAELGVDAFWEELDGWDVNPAAVGEQGICGESGAVGEVDFVFAEAGDVSDVDGDVVAADKAQKVCFVVEEAITCAGVHDTKPGAEAGRVWVVVVVAQGENVGGKEGL